VQIQREKEGPPIDSVQKKHSKPWRPDQYPGERVKIILKQKVRDLGPDALALLNQQNFGIYLDDRLNFALRKKHVLSRASPMTFNIPCQFPHQIDSILGNISGHCVLATKDLCAWVLEGPDIDKISEFFGEAKVYREEGPFYRLIEEGRYWSVERIIFLYRAQEFQLEIKFVVAQVDLNRRDGDERDLIGPVMDPKYLVEAIERLKAAQNSAMELS